MAKAVAARQFGDEYQQLVFWKYALRMLSGNYEIENIKYEDESVKSFDDVVIEYAKPQIFRDTTISKEYIQVKFHMRDDGLLTVDNLLDPAQCFLTLIMIVVLLMALILYMKLRPQNSTGK